MLKANVRSACQLRVWREKDALFKETAHSHSNTAVLKD